VLRPFGTVVAGAALAVLTTAVLSGGSTAATGPATIQIGARQTSNVRVDLGRDGTSTGDTQIIWYQLYNRRVTSRPIGHAQLVCTFTRGANRECQGTYVLPKGKLAVSGPIRFRELYELAVVGGTGTYDSARGTLTATRTSRKPWREFLVFRLAL
jgi:hypothetical protein